VPQHSTLVLYTDGLIESPAGGMSTGMARLARSLNSVSQLTVTEACDTLLAALAPHPADDIVVLMAVITGAIPMDVRVSTPPWN